MGVLAACMYTHRMHTGPEKGVRCLGTRFTGSRVGTGNQSSDGLNDLTKATGSLGGTELGFEFLSAGSSLALPIQEC